MTIEYSDTSWNCVLGCLPVSKGCEHCWAARDAATRLAHIPAYAGLTRKRDRLIERLGTIKSDDDHVLHYAFNGEVRLREDKLDEPLRKQKPQRYFVCSTSDMFYDGVQNEWRDKILAVMLLTPWHTYLICTKRPEVAYTYLTDPKLYNRVLRHVDEIRTNRCGLSIVGVGNPAAGVPSWIWWGISAERQREFEERIRWLRKLPVAKRWLSLSPLLEEVPLYGHLASPGCDPHPAIDWVVMEGESGPDARPCDLGWLRRMIVPCKEQGVPVYLKQLGDHTTDLEHGGKVDIGRRGHAGRDESCWPTDLRGNKQLPVFHEITNAVHWPSFAKARKGTQR